MKAKEEKKSVKRKNSSVTTNKKMPKIKKENTDADIEKQTYLRNQDDDYTYKDGYQEGDSDKSKKE